LEGFTYAGKNIARRGWQRPYSVPLSVYKAPWHHSQDQPRATANPLGRFGSIVCPVVQIIGVVASVAGLFINPGYRRDQQLKARFAPIKGLPEIINNVEHNLELLSSFLRQKKSVATYPFCNL
jgi:hypothetical protein